MKKEFTVDPAEAKQAFAKLLSGNGVMTTGEKYAVLAEYGDKVDRLAEKIKALRKETEGRSIGDTKIGLGYSEDDEVIVINTKGERYSLSASKSTKFDYDKVKTLFETAPDSVPDAAKKPGLQNSAAIKKLWQGGIIPPDWCEEVVTYPTKLKAVKAGGGE